MLFMQVKIQKWIREHLIQALSSYFIMSTICPEVNAGPVVDYEIYIVEFTVREALTTFMESVTH